MKFLLPLLLVSMMAQAGLSTLWPWQRSAMRETILPELQKLGMITCRPGQFAERISVDSLINSATSVSTDASASESSPSVRFIGKFKSIFARDVVEYQLDIYFDGAKQTITKNLLYSNYPYKSDRGTTQYYQIISSCRE